MHRSAVLLLVIAWCVPSLAGEPDLTVGFTDVAEKAGLAGRRGAFPHWCDFDRDGHVDLYAGGRLYHNQGPPSFTFRDVTSDLFEGSPGSQGVWADVDNNGYPDLVVPGPDKEDGLVAAKAWLNDGKGKLKPLPMKGNEALDDFRFVRTAGAGDFDLDGFVDLFFVCNEDWNDGKPRYFRSFLFRNEKGKGFSDATAKAGIGNAPPRYGRGVAFGDFNNDGLPDVYVSNYRIEDNFLWENNGDGTFRNVSAAKGVMGVARTQSGHPKKWYGHSIGSAWGDFDNDGNLDLWVSNLVHKDGKYGYHRGHICDDSKVYRNLGAPDYRFKDVREERGVPLVPLDKIGTKPDGKQTIVDELWSGAALGDFDNDGWLDAYVPQVYDLSWAFAHLYRNEEGRGFRQVAKETGIEVYDHYSGAWADYDSDGDLDLAAFGRPAQSAPQALKLFRNDGAPGRSLKVILTATESNGSAVGARLTLRAGKEIMIREREAGTSSHSQGNSPFLHFGLGDRKPDALEVRWPTGRIQFFDKPEPGAAIEAREPRSPLPLLVSVEPKPENPSPGDEVVFQVKFRTPRGGRVKEFAWDFDGDHRFDETTSVAKITHRFEKAGSYLVRVRALEARSGCAVEKTARIDVKEE